ncbi:hypothetical protein NDU88_001052 [Pleurodeles waltl]|uniref:Uncharacterized protein n=1 Tax=Pleurodeles waltl TaxID=8319 RepID=A0AAV7P318_PLEWA|nr:hypothetical protein NDU88_001052 [Pleurodeles waltl]
MASPTASTWPPGPWLPAPAGPQTLRWVNKQRTTLQTVRLLLSVLPLRTLTNAGSAYPVLKGHFCSLTIEVFHIEFYDSSIQVEARHKLTCRGLLACVGLKIYVEKSCLLTN